MFKKIILLLLTVFGVGLFANAQTNQSEKLVKKMPPPPPPPVERPKAAPKFNPPKIKMLPGTQPPPPPPPPVEKTKIKLKKAPKGDPPIIIQKPERPAPPAPPEKGNIIFN